MKVCGLPEGQGLDRWIDVAQAVDEGNILPGDPGPGPRAVHFRKIQRQI